jgi:hypothetical protein
MLLPATYKAATVGRAGRLSTSIRSHQIICGGWAFSAAAHNKGQKWGWRFIAALMDFENLTFIPL